MKILLSVFFLFVASTSGYATGPDSVKLAHMARVDKFVLEGAIFAKDTSLPTLRSLPGLKKEVSSKEPNKHDPKKETEYKTFEYDGLQIYGFVLGSGKLGLIKVTVSKPQWQILHGLTVGTDFKQVVQALGEPDISDGNLSIFRGETECVEFRTSGGLISEIQFIHYVD